ncbi:conserved hypothetical protein [Theileria orientalis strain Shintoku]|uniref:Small ribosomal subunit protein mS29 n=1 Tax=Theileria orientalis strain Shintoku TaxID=869250 RepID=J7M4J9_THEOR|nr:conserved hypothetical protein [Theileria orientalis strain Shintoku]BAM38665.1 conserved hypothetical protein [Theileria orientalis strain Shintoku]|eukprot:XP_009688966.1 conserved hypothetical protein [Theileria orientalis strain Shintoku]
MSRRLASFKLPGVEVQRLPVGARRSPTEKPAKEADGKYTSAYSLFKTTHKLSEEGYRKYGVEQGLMPPYLANPDSFAPDSKHLYSDFDDCNVYNVGSVVKLDTNQLFGDLPEGLCGDAAKDIALLPQDEPLGLVNRKSAIEIISQLRQYALNVGGGLRSRGVLLDGKRGSGKSFVLNHVALWARRNGWMVIHEPSASKYATEVGSIKRSNAGVYIQLEFAKSFLERVLMKNEHFLAQMPVVRPLYGLVSLDGNHLSYSKRMFDPVIEKIIKEELDILKEDSNPDELECAREKLNLWNTYRKQFKIPVLRFAHHPDQFLSDRLQSPKTLLEIADFGVNNETFANQAVYELFNQLKHQTMFPLLFITSTTSASLPPSTFPSSTRTPSSTGGFPATTLQCPGCFTSSTDRSTKTVSCYLVTFKPLLNTLYLARSALEFSYGCTWPSGSFDWFKIVATSWTKRKRRDFKPELLGVLPNEVRTVRNFTQREFANYILHLKNSRVIYNFPNDKINYFYMLTGSSLSFLCYTQVATALNPGGCCQRCISYFFWALQLG